MPLTTCTSPIHHSHPVLHADDECPICSQIGDLDHDLGELHATLAALRPLADRLVEMIAGATMPGAPVLRIVVPDSGQHGRETFGATPAPATPNCAGPFMPAPGCVDPYGPLQCEQHGLDCSAAEVTDSQLPADTIPESAPVEPTYPPAAGSKTKAAEILNRLPIEARIEIYKAAGIDPGKGVATWRGRPQAAHELLVACQKAEAALTPATTDTDPDTDAEPVDTNGDEAEEVAPEPRPDPEQVRARFAELRAIPKYATIRDLASKATGQSVDISTSAPDCRAMIMAHEFGESWESLLDEDPSEVQADDEPSAVTVPDGGYIQSVIDDGEVSF